MISCMLFSTCFLMLLKLSEVDKGKEKASTRNNVFKHFCHNGRAAELTDYTEFRKYRKVGETVQIFVFPIYLVKHVSSGGF